MIEEFNILNKFRRNTSSLNPTEQNYKCGALKEWTIVVISFTQMKTVKFGLVT
jgi:hypothetical protein